MPTTMYNVHVLWLLTAIEQYWTLNYLRDDQDSYPLPLGAGKFIKSVGE